MDAINDRVYTPGETRFFNLLCDVSMEQELKYQDTISRPEEGKIVAMSSISVPNDDQAFKEIYQKLYKSVYHFARTFVDAEDAEDVTANSFLKLWRSDLDYSILPKVKTWLNVCTRNACLDIIKNRQKESIKLSDFARYLDVISDTDYEEQIKEKLITRLYLEIEKLPKQCKRVFKMAYLERMRSKQIATALGITENTVTVHRVKSLKLLRLAFQDFTWLLFFMCSLLRGFYAFQP